MSHTLKRNMVCMLTKYLRYEICICWLGHVTLVAIGRASLLVLAHHRRALQLISWWCHQMETFSVLLALCAGSPVNSPHKGQWHGALIFSFICAWINGRINNREACDLRRHRAQYDVTVMCRCITLMIWSDLIKIRGYQDSSPTKWPPGNMP